MSIKEFSINGSISRYDYNTLDNKPAGGGPMYESIVDTNVWAPGIYGWELIN